MRAQDEFLRDNIERDDILVVSVGGNDVALCPAPCTIASMCGILCLPLSCIQQGFTCGTVPVRMGLHYCFIQHFISEAESIRKGILASHVSRSDLAILKYAG